MTLEMKLREEREEALEEARAEFQVQLEEAKAQFQTEISAEKKRADEAEEKIAELMKENEELRKTKK